MLNFNYYNPTRIYFGKGRLDKIAGEIPQDARVLILYGGGSAKRSGLIDKIRELLAGREIHEFGGIESNPQYDTLVRAVGVVREKNIDFMLAVGGGSVIDGTKFVALAAHYDGEPTDLLKFGFKPIMPPTVKGAVPFGVVLTLAATGSEMNMGAVVTYQHSKYSVMSPLTFPQFSVLDPTLTFTLPESQVANGVVDAFVHVTELYLTYPVGALIQDRIAESVLQTLIEVGPTSVAEPDNYVARANHEWCAALALSGVIGSGVPQDWATHMIGHELTAKFGIDHAKTLAIVLPVLLDVRREQKHAKLVQYAERVWGVTEGSDDAKIDQAIDTTRGFFESLGVKTHLSDYGVGADQIPSIIVGLEAQGMTALSETRDLTLDIVKVILEGAV
jgi:NADP-dependent alcohol dehydrogenase